MQSGEKPKAERREGLSKVRRWWESPKSQSSALYTIILVGFSPSFYIFYFENNKTHSMRFSSNKSSNLFTLPVVPFARKPWGAKTVKNPIN